MLDSSIKIFIETDPKEHVCPSCNKATSKIHDYRNQVIKDLPFQFKNTFIVLRKRRYVCPHCGKRFYESYDFSPRYHRMTNRLVSYIINELSKTVSMTTVANNANVSLNTVIRIFKYINYSSTSLPKVLSIGEFRGNTREGKFQCILVDGKKK